MRLVGFVFRASVTFSDFAVKIFTKVWLGSVPGLDGV